MKRELYELQQENQMLKGEKYCRTCRKPFASNVIIQKKGVVETVQDGIGQEGRQKGMELEFERPDFGRKKEVKSGKIWIALGLLMLVLGLVMHGVSGDKSVIR